MKIPKGKLRSIKMQMKEKVAEGEIEETNRSREWTGERPEKKRTIKRSLRAQVRASGNRPSRSRTFAFEEGDLVEIHNVPHALRKDVRRGDVGMVVSSAFNGERITIQIGPHIAIVNGTALRPLPDYDEEEEE
jgi:ribosomal protein L21E